MVEFIEKGHLYLYDDLYIIPSVTQILQKMFPDKYKNVPDDILKRKSKYGTQLHKYIEEYEKGIITTTLNYIQEASFNQYIKLKGKYNIEVLEQEQIVHYKDIYAGKFDIYGKINNEIALFDIKTTAKVDMEYFKYQLNLYRFASKNKDKIKKLYILWLPKRDLGQLIEVDVMSDKEIECLLKRCELV